MSEPISLEKYRLLVEDEFELEEILATKRPDLATLLRQLADQLDKLAFDYSAILNEHARILREITQESVD